MATIYGNSSNNNLAGTAVADKIYGYDGNDTLTGGDGADLLDGGAGDDSLAGGLGNDTYIIDSSLDVVVEAASSGTDAANVYATTIDLSSASVEIVNLYSGAVTVITNGDNNTIRGNDNSNSITSGAGNDVVYAGLGADTVTGGAGNDVLNGDAGNDVLIGDSEDDRLYGGADNDSLTGGAGNDVLSGGSGVDTMLGGTGDDTYYVDNASDSVTENASEGADTVRSEISYTLGANIENLILQSTTNINATGNTLNNVLTGNTGNNSMVGGDGNDTLQGNGGNDTMLGGTGNDVYFVNVAGDVVTENASEGFDTVQSLISYTLGNNLEKLILRGSENLNGSGNTANNQLYGNEGNNSLSGGLGNDTIDGKAGNDTLVGGLGNDQYYVDSFGDEVVEGLNEGNDRVYSYVNYTLTDNVENLVLLGSENLFAVGNTLVNNIRGNAGDNTINGGIGADVMAGGIGNDTFYVDNTGDTVTENAAEGTDDVIYSTVNYTLPTNVERLILLGSATTLTGNSGDNYLIGNGLNNTVVGGQGNDTLDGGLGNDSMDGGDGNDSYYVNTSSDVLTDSSGTDTVYSTISYTLGAGFENLVLLGASAIDGTGNASSNVITGNGSTNILSGGAVGSSGTDTLVGGDGDDTYIIDAAADVITELEGEGIDLVQVNYSGYTLGSNLENVTLMGTNAAVTGNAFDNTITGNGSANTLSGLDGNDSILGGAGADTINGGEGDDIIDGGTEIDSMTGGNGNDTYFVDSGSDVIVEGAGGGTDTVTSTVSYTLSANIEVLVLSGTAANGAGSTANELISGNGSANTLTGNDGADTLNGGASNDTLNGGNGNDVMDGGTGTDSMTGGAGDDSYYVDTTADVVVEAAASGTDTVFSSVSYTLGANFENLTLVGSQAITGTGNGANNYITGNTSSNTLSGGGGTDTLAGGAGNDTYVYSGSFTGTIVEAVSGGSDTIQADFNVDLSAVAYDNVENITFTNGSRTGYGDSGNNYITSGGNESILYGYGGNDILDSRVGGGNGIDYPPAANNADTMYGGDGDDTYIVGSWDEWDDPWDLFGWDDFDTHLAPAVLDEISDSSGNDTLVVIWTDIDDDDDDGSNNNEAGDGIETTTIYLQTGADNAGSGIYYIGDGTIENITFQGTDAKKRAYGNGSANRMIGGSGANLLDGQGGNDTISGGGGADSLYGGDGDDMIIADSGAAVIDGGNGTDTVSVNFSYALGASVENAILVSGSGNLTLTGNGSNNVLTGNEGANTLTGGTGIDTMIGGAGNDVYDVDSGSDVVTENAFSGTDQINTSVTLTLAANVENLYIKAGTGAINGTGNSLNNTLNGWDNTSRNSLTGGLGDDVYYVYYDVATVTNSDVVIEGLDAGYDAVYIIASGTLATYTMDANVEQVVLQGTATFTTVNGNALSNGIWGTFNTAGATTLAGGAGDDYYVVGANDAVSETAGNGYDTVYIADVNYTSALNNVEAVYAYNTTNYTTNFTAGRTLNFGANTAGLTIWASTFADNITGGTGADAIYGNGGADTLAGGAGNDVYFVNSGSVVITEADGNGSDTVYSTATYRLAAGIESLILQDSGGAISGTGNGYDNAITGNASANTLTGLHGNDTLDGGAGADTLVGGSGDDVYIVDNAGDVITEVVTYDYTTLLPISSFTRYGGSASPAGEEVDKAFDDNTGTKYLNSTGLSSAANSGSVGAFIDLGSAGVITSLGLTTANDASERDPDQFEFYGSNSTTFPGTLIASGTLAPSTTRFADYTDAALNFAGNTTAYRYYWVIFKSIRGTGTISQISEIRLNGSGGTDTANASVSYTLGANVENLVLTGTATGTTSDTDAINGTGNSLNNLMTGNAGDNTLDGSTGVDTMIGGAGDDIYIVESGTDVVTEAANEGTDEVRSSVSYTLSNNVEYLTLTGAGVINGTGNALANIITGNSAANVLTGGLGDDTYFVDGADTIVESAGQGTDTAFASVSFTVAAGFSVENIVLIEGAVAALNANGNEFDNFIQGNSYGNSLTGGAGSDTLDGMAGNDTMAGGQGDDVFFVDNTSDSLTENLNEGEDTVYSQASSFVMGANIENLVLVGLNDISGTGNTLDNTITGNAGNNVLSGGGGNDSFNGLQGNDTITGGTGNTAYNFARADGADSVTDTGGVDSLIFDSSVNYTQLWFVQSGSNLEISVVGTTDKVTVVNWYGGAANQIETIASGDGYTLDSGRVQTLVTAMAAFTPPALGYTDIPPEYYDSLELTFYSTWQG